ncbi:MAG: hypothetical protein HY816_13490 [Candidatus Wallbacteria bacterium]|nr:hypothetical protein [Candidatus Wallbacteria bacterium]
MTAALCQVCGESVEDDRIYCGQCHAPHHRDCWSFNGGCSIFACGGKSARASVPHAGDTGKILFIDEPPDGDSPHPWHRWLAPGRHAASLLRWPLLVGAIPAITMIVALIEPPPRQEPRARRTVRSESSFLGSRLPGFPPRRLASFGIAQVLEPQEGLPRGELVYLLDRTPVLSVQPGFNLQLVQYVAVTEAGRLFRLRASDFEIVSKLTKPGGAVRALREFRQQAARTSASGLVILVDPASQGRALAPGTILRVDRAELGDDGPATYIGRIGSQEVRIPAASCRPVLAPTLQQSAPRRS